MTPIKLSQLPPIDSGRSVCPSDVSAMKPRGSTCLPNGSSIGLPSASIFLDRSGVVGGRWRASGRTAIVIRHQTIMMTPMTVVAAMIFMARSLDSWMPLMFTRQK